MKTGAAGFTLVEMVCVITILALLFLAGGKMLYLGSQHLDRHVFRFEGNYGVRWVMHWITKDLRRGKDFVVVSPGELRCQVLLPAHSGNLVWVSVRYWLDSGGNVQRSEGLDTKPLAAGIAALTFARVPVCPEDPQVSLIRVTVKQKPHGRNYLAGVECITEVLPRSETP